MLQKVRMRNEPNPISEHFDDSTSVPGDRRRWHTLMNAICSFLRDFPRSRHYFTRHDYSIPAGIPAPVLRGTAADAGTRGPRHLHGFNRNVFGTDGCGGMGCAGP